MRGKYHEIWITNVKDRLIVYFTHNPDALFESVRYKTLGRRASITTASRKRLQRVIRHAAPENVHLHWEGPSVTYRFARGTQFPPAGVANAIEEMSLAA